MRAKDAMTNKPVAGEGIPRRCIESTTPLLEALPKLLESDERALAVYEDKSLIGTIDSASMLEALGRFLSPDVECSVIVVECSPTAYSASTIARAVEDADAHLLDLVTQSGDGHMRITLRIGHSDPSAATRSLERYGYDVVQVSGRRYADAEIAEERLNALQLFLNV